MPQNLTYYTCEQCRNTTLLEALFLATKKTPDGRRCNNILNSEPCNQLLGQCARCGIYPVSLYKSTNKYGVSKYVCKYCAHQIVGEIGPILDTENENQYLEYLVGDYSTDSRAGKHIATYISNDPTAIYKKMGRRSRGSYGSFMVFCSPSNDLVGIKKSFKYSDSRPYAELQDELTILQHLYGTMFPFQHNYTTEERIYGSQTCRFERRYITVPYCRGLTLLEYFKKLKTEGKVHFRAYLCEVCKIFYALSSTVERNHSWFQVSHNDIREDNVIVHDIPGKNEYEVHLIDYGLAKMFGAHIFNLDMRYQPRKNTIPPEFFRDSSNRPTTINNKHDSYLLCTMFIRILCVFFTADTRTINDLCAKHITILSDEICNKITGENIPPDIRPILWRCSVFIRNITTSFTKPPAEREGVASFKNKLQAFLHTTWNTTVTEATCIPMGYSIRYNKVPSTSCSLM